MTNPRECPECKSRATSRVHTERFVDEVEIVRICEADQCGAQFSNHFGFSHQEVHDL